MSTPPAIFVKVPANDPGVQFHGYVPQSELMHVSVSPVETEPLSPATISSQLLPSSVDTCHWRLVDPVTLKST